MIQRFSPAISPARRIAFDVLQSVAAGGYASDALRLSSYDLTARDAGLAGQIVFGCLRFQAQLDFLIFHYGRRRAESLEPAIVIALRTALFQLRYLERIPAHAAVHETVELVKAIKRPAAGLVNAVLRKVRRDPVPWPDRASALSCPEWLIRRWSSHFGAEAADRIARSALEEPVPYIRIPPGTEPPPGLSLQATTLPGCFRLLSAVAPEEGENRRPAGALRTHDIGSQAVLSRLCLEPGHSYLDLCAAPGNKTRQALETPLSLAVACDISLQRLQTVPAICPRVVLDGTQPLPFGRSFDRIFIDAPCSGTGTCGRNPEIKWRVQEHDFGDFGERQLRLIEAALRYLAPRGKLLYATCSLEREENENVVQLIRERHPDLLLEEEGWLLPGNKLAEEGDDRYGDGFYGARLARR